MDGPLLKMGFNNNKRFLGMYAIMKYPYGKKGYNPQVSPYAPMAAGLFLVWAIFNNL